MVNVQYFIDNSVVFEAIIDTGFGVVILAATATAGVFFVCFYWSCFK